MGSCVSAQKSTSITEVHPDQEKNESHGQNDHSQHEGGQKSLTVP